MRVLMINSVCGIRSTGRICTDLADRLIDEGHECRIAYGREQVPVRYASISYRIGTDRQIQQNGIKARIFDNEGLNAKRQTEAFLKWATAYDPELLWLHNLHGYYINYELLFDWIKSRPQMQVKWTLHDCWAFTGHCAYFSYVGCRQWETGCVQCPQKKEYPKSIGCSNCKQNYIRKQHAFCGVLNMTLVTPSNWLASLVRKSFLKEYPIEVIYNRINTEVFRPTPGDFRERYGLQNKTILLGVATVWDARKGLDDFVALSSRLDDSYRIVLIGLSEEQCRRVPASILCLPRTDSAEDLAKWYTTADVFLNPSKEETFGLTTVEALACGTPAIVYQDTACEEIVASYGGIAVPQSVDALEQAVYSVVGER